MIIATIDHVPGYKVVKVLGVVSENTVGARHIGRLGADAVINVRSGTSAIMGGASEILAYGTAVKLGPE